MDEQYLSVLTGITALLLRDATPDEVCDAVFQKLGSVLQFDLCFHSRVSSDGTHLNLASCRGCPAERLSELESVEFGRVVCGTVAITRQPMYVARVSESVNEITSFVHSIGITCYVCQPLIVNNQFLGTFSFGSRIRTEYTEQELHLIQLVCDQVAIANSRDVAREQHARLERMAVAGQMAAKIAHEINNPLEAATNALFLLDRMPIGDEAKAYVEIAQEQIRRVAGISKQTLGFYRQFQNPAPVNLRHVTDNVLAANNFSAMRKRLRFAVDVPHDLHVRAISSELTQILTNLVANAIHYSPESETVSIAALRRRDEVELFISDRGPGVSDEHSSKLFQPFYTTNKESGNGLGLWISRELARRAEGDLLLVPSDEGATFKLLLQAASSP